MNDCILRVDKLANGYEVSIADPKIIAENEKPKGGYKDPWVEYAFSTAPEALAFISAHLESLTPEPDGETLYGQEFIKQAQKLDEEE